MPSKLPLLPAACLLAACVSTNAAVLDPTVKYQKICPDGVRIFTSAARVDGDYREVALLHSKGESGWTDERGMSASQRGKAAQLGANGIIAGDIKEPNAGTKIIGAVLGTGSERKGAALAIYIPGDSDRVAKACYGQKGTHVASSGPVPAADVRPEATPTRVAAAPASPPPAYGAYPVATENSAPVIPTVERPQAGTLSDTTSVLPVEPPPVRTSPMVIQARGRHRELQVSSSEPGAQSLDLLTRDPEVRNAIHDLKRLNIASEVREVAPGLLIVEVGSAALAPGTALAYQLGQLYVAYGGAVSPNEHVVIELWQSTRKVGEYGGTGLLLGVQ
jgi:hypothetical protein